MTTARRPLASVLACVLALSAGSLLVAATAGQPLGASPLPHTGGGTTLVADATPVLPPAPVWKIAPGAMPTRPASCPTLPAASSKAAPSKAAPSKAAASKAAASPAAASTATLPAKASPAGARSASTLPAPPAQTEIEGGDALWPPPPAGADPEDYATFDHTSPTAPLTVPANWSASGNNWKLASTRSTSTAISSNPQELCGVEGASVDEAWQTTTGNPTTVIAVLDSGIEWCSEGVVDKIYLNRAALPLPENAAGLTKPELESSANPGPILDQDPYDLDETGVFNVQQYANDPRVASVVAHYGGFFCAGSGGYTGISPEDLIRTFADPTMPALAPATGTVPNPNVMHLTGPAGYTEAIAGWNVLDNDDDPYDDVGFDHGTGEANDMAGAANSLSDEVGACPDCMVLPVRVGTSFVTTGNDFADGVLFAADSGATVISEALGALDETETARQAIAYANSKGIPIVGSAADEESEHQNLPGSMGHIIVVNSTNSETGWSPASYLYLNGCTNYGAEISVTVPSSSCSSEATGKAAGMIGLLESAAADAVEAKKIGDYPGLHDALGQAVPLSADEVQQLVTMSADDVDFATAAPHADPPAPADNYAVSAQVPFATTKMFPTTPGYDEYTGWGRINAARIMQWVAAGRIPPEAEIESPSSFETFAPSGTLTVTGMVGAVRSSSWRYQVDVGVGVSPANGSWHLAAEGSGHLSKTGVLARIPLASIADLFPGGAAALTGGAVGADGAPEADKFTFTVRVVVEDAKGLIGVDQAAEFLHADPDLVASYHFDSSIVAPPRLAPLGPGGENVLLVATAGGTIDALLPGGKELPGWPVHTDFTAAHLGELAYTSGAVNARPMGEIMGGVAVGDLADASGHALDVVAADMAGNIYAWSSSGKLLPGWPQHSDPAFSEPSARNGDNRLLPDFFAAPALADLQGNGQLDAIEPSFDRHLYAFQPDGKAVPGWPVLVVDPSEVSSVDPTTEEVNFLSSAQVDRGTELVDTPAIGSLDGGSGPPDVIIGSDEEYGGNAYANLGALGTLLSAVGAPTANSRVYAIYPDGTDHPLPGGAAALPPGDPDNGAIVPGWPAQIAQLDAGLLPTIGDGVTGSPALADLAGNGRLEVVTASSAGPIYVLNPDGTSYLGYGTGHLPNIGGYEPSGGSILDWTMPAVGSPIVSPIGPAKAAPSLVSAAASVGKLLDTAFPGSQTPNENELAIWSAKTGALSKSGPDEMSDLQFLDQPIVADVNGTAAGSYVIEGSGLYDLRAYGPNGAEAPDFPKFTGGWTTFGGAFGPWGSLPDQVLAASTRSGSLLVWTTPTPSCAPSGPWPQVHQNLWNTQNLEQTGTPSPTCTPAPVGSGYRLVARDGGIFAFHESFDGSLPGRTPPGLDLHVDDVAAIAPSPRGGYWVIARNGGVFSFGAPYFGSLTGIGVRTDDVVGAVATFDGAGYWLVSSDGAVYPFGDARSYGSLSRGTATDIVGIASPDPGGYWLVSSSGDVYPFGDALSDGSCTAAHSVCGGVGDIVGIAAAGAGGYWLAGRDGGIFSFGDARFLGSCPLPGSGCQGAEDVVGIAAADAGGYLLAESTGAVIAFGDARNYGDVAGDHLTAPVVGIS